MARMKQPRSVFPVYLAVLGVLLSAGAAGRAAADGKVFAREGVVATIPDQRALIHFADGVQTLVIETRFESSGSPAGGQQSNGESAEGPSSSGELAWVVPVPSVPELIEVTPGLMPTVQASFQPRLKQVNEAGNLFAAAICVVILVLIMLSVRGIGVVAAGLLGFCFVFVVLFFLPALGKSRGLQAGESGEVTVHDRRMVGLLDVATISGESGNALISWLADNGFLIAPDSSDAIDAYAKEGWTFCAARLVPDGSGKSGPATPYPLGCRFKAEKPIYPMRLTATGSESLSVDLYVFGSGMASATNFKAVRCGSVVVERSNPFHPPSDDRVQVGHEGLAELIGNAMVATKLTATLTPEQMRQDVVIDWVEKQSIGAEVYGRVGARDRAIAAGSLVVIAGALLTLFWAGLMKPTIQQSGRHLVGVLLLAFVTSGVVRLATLTVETVERPWPWANVLHSYVLSRALEIAGVDLRDPSTRCSAEVVRAAFSQAAAEVVPDPAFRPREEDSPFNYTLETDDDTVVFRGFDEVGYPVYVYPIPVSREDSGGAESERTPDPSGP